MANPRDESEKMSVNHTAPNDSDSETEEVFHDARYPADEEARLVEESNTIKAEANKLFTSKSYDQAVSYYDRALASCPNYFDYEVAVLKSNVAACYLKLEDWKAAVDSATTSLERLDNIIPQEASASDSNNSKGKAKDSGDANTDAVVEISGDDEEEELERLQKLDERKKNVLRIRAKALMRRAKAKMQLGGWGNLQGAEEDYKALESMENLPPEDMRIVKKTLRELPERIGKAREKEMAEMMGKLKELGNGILKPFGLSTDNFNFVKDPKTGGYSMNFQS